VGGELDKIAMTARESLTAMDAIVWALNPLNDSIENFANYISHFANEFFRPTSIRCRLDIPTQLPQQTMSTEARHHLFLAVKEALNNVARHSGASQVWIRLSCGDGRLVISVEDNGRGMDANSAEPGQDGLVNIRRRLEALSGTVTMGKASVSTDPNPTAITEPKAVTNGIGDSGRSAQGGGTCLRFSVPLARLNS
jgi:signal transduction histidine kinase